MTEKEMLEMDINTRLDIFGSMVVVRVPGGWIYDIDCTHTFVPEPPKKKTASTSGTKLFKNSEIGEWEKFAYKFGVAKYEGINLKHYYNILLEWSEGGGKMKKSWYYTALQWLRRDLQDGKIKLLKGYEQKGNQIIKTDGAKPELK